MMLTAHSGSDGTPDNSRIFLKTMLKAGIACVELDVRKTDKGILYLSHDKDKWTEATLSLEGAFQMLASDGICMVNCDLKEENLEKAVLSLAEKYKLMNRLIFSGKVQLENISADHLMKKVYFNAENILPDLYVSQGLNEEKVKQLIDFCKKNKVRTVNLNYHFVTNEWIRLFHQEKIKVSVWTVNDFSEINRFIEIDVHNITTRLAISYNKHQKEVQKGND